VIILLSDGLNTEDRWPDYGDGSTRQNGSPDPQFPGKNDARQRIKIDARQRILCDNLKNDRDAQNRPMYTISTVQVNTATPADPGLFFSIARAVLTSSTN
jgi:hypothetical protein